MRDKSQSAQSALIQSPLRFDCVRPAGLKENYKKALRQKWRFIISA